MPDPTSVRVDSWAWAVRLFKTRSAASDACKAGHLKVNGDRAKPSQPVKVGDEVRAFVSGTEKIYIARRLIVKRVGAALARFHRGALVDPGEAQHVRSRAFHEAQVIGVIDHARQISVLEIDAHRESVLASVEAPFDRLVGTGFRHG